MKTLNTDLAVIQLNQVIEQLEDLLFCDLVMTYNDYAGHNGYEMIYDNDEYNINTLFDTPYKAAQAVVCGKYNPSDDYVMLDGYGLMSSFSYQLIQDDNCPIDISELARWLINEDKLGGYDITVTTLDDMLDSIKDYITDDSNMLSRLFDCLNTPMYYQCFDGSDNDKVSEAMNEINDYNYNQLSDIINYLGINYE